MPTSIPFVNEPTDTKRLLNEAHADVREATLRQASDIAAPVYHLWKDDLREAGLTWQAFQSAASTNQDAWRSWLRDEISWRGALKKLIEHLNEKSASASFTLAE